MQKNLSPVRFALIVGTLIAGPGSAHALIIKSYQAPSDNASACDKRVQLAITRVKRSVPGTLHFSCEAGLVQQLWFSDKSAVGAQWMQFVLKNNELFAPKGQKLKPSDSEHRVIRYWRGLKILNNGIYLVSAAPNGQFAKHASMGLTVGLLSDFPDTRRLTGNAPKITVAAAKKAAQLVWDKERPGGTLAFTDTELGLYFSKDGNFHLAWVINGQGMLKKDETGFSAGISYNCIVNADTGIPEQYDCSTYGYSL